MQVRTGKGMISAMVVVAIWSLSLGVNLPGLAVTPILDMLDKLFTDVSEFKIQLLTVLPNLLIIPFMLLAGRLSESRYKVAIVITALSIYVLAGVLYLFASSMTELIWISCLLGAGCGLLIPYSTGFVADVFCGPFRMRQMGIVSAIGNISLVVATFAVGVLALYNWHFPFLVYLIPVVSLLLSPWLFKIPFQKADQMVDNEQAELQSRESIDDVTSTSKAKHISPRLRQYKGFLVIRLLGLLGGYFVFIFVSALPSYYVSFLLPKASTTDISIINSIFFFAMFLMGMTLSPVLRRLRESAFLWAIGMIITGLVIFLFTRNVAVLAVAYGLIGLGNGMAQPIFYDKATETVAQNSKSTMALAFLLVANYLAISAIPVVVSGIEGAINMHSAIIPFVIDVILALGVAALVVWQRKSFTFTIKKEYYT